MNKMLKKKGKKYSIIETEGICFNMCESKSAKFWTDNSAKWLGYALESGEEQSWEVRSDHWLSVD